MAAWISLAAPILMMILATIILPKDDPPLHPADNSWYFQLTVFVCVLGMIAAGWALAHRPAKSASIAALAIFGILCDAVVGLVSIFLSSIHGMHT